MNSTTHMKIDYKSLRKINPEAARMAVLEYLKAGGGNVAEVARVFGIQRPVIYDILRKKGEGDLTDRSKAPNRSPNKTPHQHLKETLPEIDDSIKFVIPFILDDVSTNLGPWSGYHLLAHYPK